jgi:peptidoglycan hydrolase CwlO-like protein
MMKKKILVLTCVVALIFPLVLTGCKDHADQERLQNELTKVKAAAQTASEKAKRESDDLKAQVKSLTEQRDALAQQVDELNQQAPSREQLRKQVAESTETQQKLQKLISDLTSKQEAQRQKLTEVTRSRDTLQQEVDTLSKSRDAAVAETQRAQAKIEDLTTKLQVATEKVGELQEQLQTAAVDMDEGIEAPPVEAIESPIIRSFTTTRPRVYSGQKSTLSWWVTDADNVRIEPNIGTVGTLGSRTIAPTKTTTYTLIATNENGESTVTRRIEVQ